MLLLEASRRAEGPWMPIIAIVVLLYVFAGPYLPGCWRTRARRSSRAASHFWLTSEGVFGVALGVSTNFIFLFVLFGALLEKAGAGNYFIQLAFSLLGQFRGGPAKAGVVVVRHDRHDLRLLGRQRGDHRHLHDPADEARRLYAGARPARSNARPASTAS